MILSNCKHTVRAGVISLAAGVILAGCGTSPMSVDEQVRRLAAEGAGRAHLGVSPEPGARADLTGTRPAQINTRPDTRNPDPAALTFTPAPADRDVASRLTAIARASGVPMDGVVARSEGVALRTLTLEDALRQSQDSGREILSAQEAYLLASINLLTTRHQWGPRLFNDTTLSLAGQGDDGRFEHTARLINRLRVTKRLPFGGTAEAAWVWNASENLREQSSGRYRQSSSLVLSGTVPLLRGAGLIAREDLIQGERDLVYAAREFERFRREYLVSIASDFFELLNSKAAIANAEHQLESLRQNAARTEALVASGRLKGFERDIARSEVLSQEASLAGQRDQYILQLARFRVRLGLAESDAIDVAPTGVNLPEPEAEMDQAVLLALDLRLDLQNQRDRLDDRRRGVVNAKNQLLPDLNLSARATLPTDDDANVGHADLSPDDADYSVEATLSLPLDRKEQALRLRASQIQLQRSIREYEQARDEVIVRVRAALRNIELARFQLTLAEKQVEINERRKRGQELQKDTIDAQRIVDTENSLAASRNQRDRAQTNLRVAVLEYLLASDQLRVKRDGTIDPPAGMTPVSTP